jgi:replicative DNA helicase
MANLNDANLPYSLDAEQAVLGSILLDSKLIASVTDKLTAESFHVGLHSDIFSVMLQMFVTGKPIDIVTVIDDAVVTEKSGRRAIFDNQADAKVYLTKLMESAISPSSIESYARIIDEKHKVRQLMYASNEIFELAGAGTEEAQSLLEFAETKIYNIRREKDIAGLMPIKPVLLEKLKELSEIEKDPVAYNSRYVSTSYKKLDDLIHGFSPADLIIVAGRPGSGKTTFAVNVAVNIAKKYRDKKIAVFSFEMQRTELVERILVSEARVTTNQMRNGKIGVGGWKNISSATDFLSNLGIYIDDTPDVSIAEMKAKLRRMKGEVSVVFIDYLQLMSLNRKDLNRVYEIQTITQSLKKMAKELGITVILASQLSREVEKRQEKHPDKNKLPLLSDLKDSGAIEQDADIVIMLNRASKDSEFPNKCECVVAKNRRGETGVFDLNFEGEYYSFTSADFIHANEY